MKTVEHDIQATAIRWFRYQYPNHIIYAVPNGSYRNKITAARLKEEGVLAGVPDVFIPVARKDFHGLYVEFKAEKNRLTQSQILIIDKLMQEGYQCEVCYSFDDFRKIVNNYLL
ncbi:MAG: VRR-NUC domain-containing protein [Candidatus Azobacteroides sp.]|nr:VRR-NUC domain-containing protein [Candidatus Azobacteroides sp.]